MDMKTRNIFIALLLAVLCVAPMFARQFEKGEMLYVNADQSGREGSGNFNWSKDGAKLFLYIWKDTNGQPSNQDWISLAKENGNLYSGAVPSARDYNRCIVVRKSSTGTAGNWNDKWNQTGDITIPDAADRNSLDKFWDGGDGSEWQTYTPTTDKIAAYVSDMSAQTETIVVCPSAMGGPFSLRVKLNQDKTAYDYNNVQCHGWYKSANGTSWASVDGYAGKTRNGEDDKDILKNNLPASGPVYYYLHSAKAAGRRLIMVTTEGAKDCDLDCTITAFKVATSAVNANDTTYTLDGMVAFGEPNGDLVITCDGKSVTIADAKSPQTFSIPGLRAATSGGKKTTATAAFTGNSGCTATATVDIPNATQGIVRTHLDVLVGETTPLNPTGANYENDHKWYIDGEEEPEMHGKQSSTAFNESNTTYYTYREFNPPSGDMDDMMSNGSYEDEFDYGTMGQKSTISDYNFWGKYPQTDATAIDFYTNPTVNPEGLDDNGFAVVKNANNFFYTYAKITARDGDYFALFDAASDGVPNKKAWLANTAKNEKLKLQKGTTYLFSFWAANINNYGEMDNAAKLQFQIEYNGKTEKLGSVLDLGSSEFRNNRWHQCSATFYADADADNVTISVVNLNTNKLNTGNDFALDDIQFRAVSSATRSVRIQQVFEVQTHEPHVYKLTAAAQPMACDETSYQVSLTVTYDNPKGKLVIMDLTAGKEVFNGNVPTQGADWDKQKTKTVSVKIDGLEPADHRFKAYFAEWTKSYAEASSTAPEFTSCCVEGLIYRKWENVLFVDNGKGLFTAYQWYKNNQKLQGETKQRYYTGQTPMAGTTDTYYCEVTRKDGTTEKTCAHTFDEFPRSAEHTAVEDIMLDGIAVWPTQVAAGASITIRKTYSGSVRATLLTLTGQTVSSDELRGDEHTMVMPDMTGLYLLQLQGSSTQRTVKINVY